MRIAIVALVLVVAARTAVAAPELVVQGDACPMEALGDKVERVAAELDAGRVARRVIVEVERGEPLVARLWFEDEGGHRRGPREVSALSCDELIESIVLVISIALPEIAREQAGRPAPVAVAPAEPAVTPPAEPIAPARVGIESVAVREPTAGHAFDLGAYVGAASGMSSDGLNAQLVLGVRVARGRASAAVQVRADAPQERVVSEVGRIRIARAELSLAPCLRIGGLAGCAVGGVSFVRGSGLDLVSARRATIPLVVSGVRLIWEHGVSARIALRVHAEAQATLGDVTFAVDYMPVWSSPRAEGSVGVGLLARFL